jgi:hypothetical protein
MKFTAIIVSGATSDAEHLLVMSVTRFGFAAGPARTTLILKNYACI